MKINEVEKATGITCANIRYYERKELLLPERGNENNYRVYHSDDIERLKQIKILRMMGVPIADIKDIFDGKLDLKTTMSQRVSLLEEEEKNITTVKNICQTVLQYDMDLSMLNEELLTENVELWQQKLSYINLEEKANILNRKVCIVLCIITILLCFSPIVFYNGYLCNIIQLFLLEELTSRVDILISIILLSSPFF